MRYASTAIPTGVLKRAEVPFASTSPAVEPASVVTTPERLIFLILLFTFTRNKNK